MDSLEPQPNFLQKLLTLDFFYTDFFQLLASHTVGIGPALSRRHGVPKITLANRCHIACIARTLLGYAANTLCESILTPT